MTASKDTASDFEYEALPVTVEVPATMELPCVPSPPVADVSWVSHPALAPEDSEFVGVVGGLGWRGPVITILAWLLLAFAGIAALRLLTLVLGFGYELWTWLV